MRAIAQSVSAAGSQPRRWRHVRFSPSAKWVELKGIAAARGEAHIRQATSGRNNSNRKNQGE